MPKIFYKKPEPPRLVVTDLDHTNCRGKLYEFKLGARIWRERQQRFPVINGPMAGQFWTRIEWEQNRYHLCYEPYTSARAGQTYTRVYVYVENIKPRD